MDTIKSILIDETINLFTSGADVARGGAYIYPFKGIFFLSTNKPLWYPALTKTTPTATLGLGVTSAMFFFTYIPQTAIMSITSGPLLAPITTAFLVLSESSTITNYLARRFLLEDALVDTFDGTLVACGQEKLVQNGREVQNQPAQDPVKRLGVVVEKQGDGAGVKAKAVAPGEKITPQTVLKSLLLLPLNFVPVIGTVLYVFVQGKKLGSELHERYFELKGWNNDDTGKKKRGAWLIKNRGAYTGLGMAAVVLEMIPFASIAFSFTNAVGAALWAADLESV